MWWVQYFGKNPQEADGGVVGLHQVRRPPAPATRCPAQPALWSSLDPLLPLHRLTCPSHPPTNPVTSTVQDWTYWAHPSVGPTGNPEGGGWGGSGLCTCWVALGDVGPESGPLLFVRGSHRWGVEISDLTLSRQDNHLVRDEVEVSPMAVSSERRFSACPERFVSQRVGTAARSVGRPLGGSERRRSVWGLHRRFLAV